MIPLPVSNGSAPPLVTIRELRVELGGQPVLNGVNADLLRGKVTALIGLNGSGKTTLLRAMVREYPFQGEIRFHCGHDHTKPTPEHIGYVPQKLTLEARLPVTVKDLLGLALSRRPLFLGLSRATVEKIRGLLARVGMTDHINTPVEGLSGGQLQRVLLALALEPQPELLLLDEPAAGIDFKDQQKFYDLIAELNRSSGVTVLLVSHELSMVSRHADHVLCLRDGKIACQGPPKEILTPANLSTTFGTDMQQFHHQHPH
ncbi:MAG TPA: metal ABC transporter ATP-binding protein [Gemmataceae bacterium]|nr:metal ABC transporter ATP-binding protein [Gemmataceae bacterium]